MDPSNRSHKTDKDRQRNEVHDFHARNAALMSRGLLDTKRFHLDSENKWVRRLRAFAQPTRACSRYHAAKKNA
jgi:hypothetical protein